MKTAGDVIKRLLWDADFAHGRQIVVWYHDRFEGISCRFVGTLRSACNGSIRAASGMHLVFPSARMLPRIWSIDATLFAGPSQSSTGKTRRQPITFRSIESSTSNVDRPSCGTRHQSWILSSVLWEKWRQPIKSHCSIDSRIHCLRHKMIWTQPSPGQGKGVQMSPQRPPDFWIRRHRRRQTYLLRGHPFAKTRAMLLFSEAYLAQASR